MRSDGNGASSESRLHQRLAESPGPELRIIPNSAYFALCGAPHSANFLIWDATGIKNRRARHTGRVKHVVREFHEDLVRISADITTAEYDVFAKAKETRFVPDGPNENEQAIKRLNKEFKLSESDAREVVDLVYAPENPQDMSVWGIVNGLTSAAKAHRYAEDRTRVGALAGRVLSAAS